MFRTTAVHVDVSSRKVAGQELWVTAQGLTARNVDREVTGACAGEAASSIAAIGMLGNQ